MSALMSPAESARRADIVGHATEWVGTPYVHQASAIGQGTDCLGLIRGVWRHLYGQEPEAPPPYTPGWGTDDSGGAETLLEAATRHLTPQTRRPMAGDVLLFRMAPGGAAKHCGIHIGGDRFVHAYSGRAVTTAWLGRYWHARIAAVLSYPE